MKGRGVLSAAMILDGTPVSTRAQATSVADISTRRGIKSVALVTSPLHSYRAARAFRKAGVTVVSTPGVAAAPSILLAAQDHFFGRLGLTVQALYEYLALSLYWWRGWI